MASTTRGQILGSAPQPSVMDIVRRFWGYDRLWPLQSDAIQAALAGRDSLVVLPTGGGKSLCYQVPPAVSGGTDVVISPLISLMKDQVDGLRECGYPAVALHSGLDGRQRQEAEKQLAKGECRLLFLAPERAVTPWLVEIGRKLNVRRFAIDEAHCISHWGHDFRPEYRQLADLRKHFPQASFHAFTATATPRVRADIARQLGLRDPAVLVGSFDRPNLVYRVMPLVDVYGQSIEVIRHHVDEAVIVYCISRKDTENLAAALKANGIAAEAYHAGMESAERHRVQEAFAQEKLNVVVATVAFGMGIDRSNVRCVLHTAMPKSIEHYQQETGRAGRDGLEAECVLLYSYGDRMRWESLLQKNSEDIALSAEQMAAQLELLDHMQRYCNQARCRHRGLVEYFGQSLDRDNCQACDVCLGEGELVADALVVAQKILSCVGRIKESFGVGQVVDVLTGADTEMVRRCKHDQLSTYGLLRELPKKHIQSFVFQLVDQELLERTAGDRPILKLNDNSWAVLRGQCDVKLLKPKDEAPSKAQIEADSWEGVDRGLFDHLRQWRMKLAGQRGVPPYVILHDATLRNLARVRPTKLDALQHISGMGEKRIADYGDELLRLIKSYCQEHRLDADQADELGKAAAAVDYVKPIRPNAVKQQAFEMFRQGQPIDDVKHRLNRARSTIAGYLAEYILSERPTNISVWVDESTYHQVVQAAAAQEQRLLSPIFEHLDGRIPYDAIRLVLAHLEAMNAEP